MRPTEKIPERKTTREKKILQWHFMGRLVLLSLLLGVSLLIETGGKIETFFFLSPRYLLGFIAVLYFYTMISALLMNRIRRIRPFAAFQLSGDVAMITLLIMASGGSQSIFTALYFFPIITASFLFKRTATLFIAAISSLLYGFALFLEYLDYGILTPLWKSPLTNIITVLHLFSIHGLLFFLVAGLSIFLAEKLIFTERALSQSSRDLDQLQLLYRQVFNDITTGIITLSRERIISSINPAATEITGYRADEVSGRKINEIFPGFELTPSNGQRTLIDLIRKDKRSIPVGFSWTRLNMPESCDNCRVITMQDLSRFREMEKRIKQAEKMATIGGMAAGIAHDFRNPLAAISGAAQVLTDDLTNSSADSQLCEIIVRECSRMENTITDFLRFSRPASPEPEWFSLPTMVDEVIDLLARGENRSSADKIIHNDVSENLDCWADQSQFRHLIMNLLANSLNAVKNQKDPSITVEAEEIKTIEGRDITSLTVTDNGPGISEEIREDIFEPFFTTRENGTGLGLAIVKQIIDNHQGKIEIATSPGQTVFTIHLPLPQE